MRALSPASIKGNDNPQKYRGEDMQEGKEVNTEESDMMEIIQRFESTRKEMSK